jgi:hypothetical protein
LIAIYGRLIIPENVFGKEIGAHIAPMEKIIFHYLGMQGYGGLDTFHFYFLKYSLHARYGFIAVVSKNYKLREQAVVI